MKYALALMMALCVSLASAQAQVFEVKDDAEASTVTSGQQGGVIQGSAQEYSETESAKKEREEQYIGEPAPYYATNGSMMWNFTQGFSRWEYDF